MVYVLHGWRVIYRQGGSSGCLAVRRMLDAASKPLTILKTAIQYQKGHDERQEEAAGGSAGGGGVDFQHMETPFLFFNWIFLHRSGVMIVGVPHAVEFVE